MKVGIACLLLGYVLSQFYRAFLAVLSPVLGREVGAGPDDLALSSGLWFLAFAALQLPVGAALDSLGPRRTSGWLMALGGGGGAAIFAMATAPWHLHAAMVLIGAGCAPVLMASYYIFGRTYAPAVFATLAGAFVGFGTLGNLAGALPLAWAAETFGWRPTVWALAALTLATGLALLVLVRDPPPAERAADAPAGSMWDVFRIPAVWLILPLLFVNYAPAGAVRGLWVGPWVGTIYGPELIGQATLIMALAMVLGAFVYGPLDRLLGTRKGVVLVGNLGAGLVLLALGWWPAPGYGTALVALAAMGMLGLSYPLIMAHGRAFFPPHLLGRGVTLLNMFSIGGVGLMQVASRQVYAGASGGPPEAAFSALFLFFGLALLAGCAVYAFSRDRMD
jgi:predicted MFS family arabinose efflux permease